MDNNEQSAIEEEFSQSWDLIERFFLRMSEDLEWIKPIFNLIAELRVRGYDRQFRAGQGMTTFMLSRSREHGLRRGQAYVAIILRPDSSVSVDYFGSNIDYFSPHGEVKIEIDQPKFTPELEALLERLAAHPID